MQVWVCVYVWYVCIHEYIYTWEENEHKHGNVHVCMYACMYEFIRVVRISYPHFVLLTLRLFLSQHLLPSDEYTILLLVSLFSLIRFFKIHCRLCLSISVNIWYWDSLHFTAQWIHRRIRENNEVRFKRNLFNSLHFTSLHFTGLYYSINLNNKVWPSPPEGSRVDPAQQKPFILHSLHFTSFDHSLFLPFFPSVFQNYEVKWFFVN